MQVCIPQRAMHPPNRLAPSAFPLLTEFLDLVSFQTTPPAILVHRHCSRAQYPLHPTIAPYTVTVSPSLQFHGYRLHLGPRRFFCSSFSFRPPKTGRECGSESKRSARTITSGVNTRSFRAKYTYVHALRAVPRIARCNYDRGPSSTPRRRQRCSGIVQGYCQCRRRRRRCSTPDRL